MKSLSYAVFMFLLLVSCEKEELFWKGNISEDFQGQFLYGKDLAPFEPFSYDSRVELFILNSDGESQVTSNCPDNTCSKLDIKWVGTQQFSYADLDDNFIDRVYLSSSNGDYRQILNEKISDSDFFGDDLLLATVKDLNPGNPNSISILSLYQWDQQLNLHLVDTVIRQSDWGFLNSVTFSPDGEKVATLLNTFDMPSLLVYSFENSELSLRYDIDIESSSYGSVNWTDYTWSSHSGRIAVVSDFDILVVSEDGSSFVNLTATPDIRETGPAWSPAEEQLAFIRSSEFQDEIVIFDLDLMAETAVFSSSDMNYYSNLIWSADGQYIAFNGYLRDKSNGTNIQDFPIIESGMFIIRKNGTGLIRISGNARDFDWKTEE